MQKNLEIFSDRFRGLRVGESQGAFAKRLGIGQVTVSQYERGDREPSLTTLKQIAECLSVSADYLLGLSDSPSPPGQGANSATNSPGAAVGPGASVRTVPPPPALKPCGRVPTGARK